MRLIGPVAAMLAASSAALADCNHPVPVTVAPTTAETAVEREAPTASVDCYQFTAQANQRVFIGLSGANKDAVFTLYAPGWKASCNTADDCDIDGDQLSDDQATSWLDAVPATGLYLIVIDNSRSDADYRLSVEFR